MYACLCMLSACTAHERALLAVALDLHAACVRACVRARGDVCGHRQYTAPCTVPHFAFPICAPLRCRVVPHCAVLCCTAPHSTVAWCATSSVPRAKTEATHHAAQKKLKCQVGRRLDENSLSTGKLNLVDLAGSEKVLRSRHRRRHVYCAGIGVPVLQTTASARAF